MDTCTTEYALLFVFISHVFNELHANATNNQDKEEVNHALQSYCLVANADNKIS